VQICRRRAAAASEAWSGNICGGLDNKRLLIRANPYSRHLKALSTVRKSILLRHISCIQYYENCDLPVAIPNIFQVVLMLLHPCFPAARGTGTGTWARWFP
jgi:hypothetical protein